MRGRTRTPDELKRLKGNRRKEKLPPPETHAGTAVEVLEPQIEVPAFLKSKREKEIFRHIMREFVPRNIARSTDYAAYARYATYLHLWISAREDLGKQGRWYETDSTNGAGGVKMLRRNPAVTDMLDFGNELLKMERELGLTPLSRQSIMARMRVLGAAGAGGLFPNEPGAEPGQPDPETPDADASPLGFLANAAAASPAKN